MVFPTIGKNETRALRALPIVGNRGFYGSMAIQRSIETLNGREAGVVNFGRDAVLRVLLFFSSSFLIPLALRLARGDARPPRIPSPPLPLCLRAFV